MKKVKFKHIIGYEGKYEVSSVGDVYSLTFHRGQTRVKLRASLAKGYPRVTLFKNGERNVVNIHRLVAAAFVKGYRPGYVVNHKDGDRANNNFSNLEWCTQSHNVLHGYHVMNRKPVCIGKFGGSHPASKRVVRIDKFGRRKVYESQMDAARDVNRDSCTISGAIRGNQATAAGYRWEYE